MAKKPTMNTWEDWIRESIDHNHSLWRQIGETKRELEDKELWEEIREATKTNVTLQAEFERLKVLYFLIKEQTEGGADGG